MAPDLVAAPATVAFDRLAPEYDRLASGDLFAHQRRSAHRRFAAWLPVPGRVLEIGCGTGLDMAFLAAGGSEVLACDPSPGMRRLTRQRAAADGLTARVRVVACGLETLPAWLDAGEEPPFDAVVSNFGALNCVGDLTPLGTIARRHLRPGASVLIGVMGRHCLWEMAYLAATGRLTAARRRLAPGPMVSVAGVAVPTTYHTLDEIDRALGPELALTGVHGLGVFAPPPYLERRWQQLPCLVRDTARALDRFGGAWPVLNRCGDHVLARWVTRRHGRA